MFALKYAHVIMWFYVIVPPISIIAAILVSLYSLHSREGATRRCYSIFKHMHIPDTLWKNFIFKKTFTVLKQKLNVDLFLHRKFSFVLTKATFILLQVKISRC